MNITDFLLARLAEDEASATEAAAWVANGPEPRFEWFGAQGDIVIARFGTAGAHVAKWSPARVLAECAAKRAIVNLYEGHRDNRDARRRPRARAAEDEQAARDRRTQEARCRVAEDAMFALATVYADHPDYLQEWVI